MHADGKLTLASVSKWNSGKVNCQLYFYSVLETNSSTIQPWAGHQNFIQANLYSTHCNIIIKYLKSSLKKDINDNVPDQVRTLAQVGTSPNLGWPNKELRGSQPIYELFCPSWDPLGIPIKQKVLC